MDTETETRMETKTDAKRSSENDNDDNGEKSPPAVDLEKNACKEDLSLNTGDTESIQMNSNLLDKDVTIDEAIEVVYPVSNDLSTDALNFEISSTMNEVSKSAVDHQLPLPNEVSYTEKCTMQAEEDIQIAVLEDQDGNSNDSSKIVCFMNQDGKVTPSPILQYVLDVDQPFDTVISCIDGRIGAHRLVLASASPFIGDMFCSHDHRLGEVATLVLPDVRVSIMKVLLNFCYTGTMFFPKEDEQEVVETIKLLLLGEFGDLSMKEVIVKLPPRPPPAVPVTGNPQYGPELQQVLGTSSGGSDEVAGPSASLSTDAARSLEDICETSSEDEKEGDESSGEEDDGNYASSQLQRPVYYQYHDDEKERLDFANNFIRHKKDEESSINYLIGPKPPGSKTKKLQCYHCPGAFKTLESLTNHLENNHGVDLQSKNLTKSEYETLTNCGICSNKHDQIGSASNCISRRSRTRCLSCFQVVRLKEFAEHVKTCHVVEQKNGLYIVKCNWCDAGVIFQEPLDNKAMAAHCYSSHFPNSRNGCVSIDFAKEEETKEENKVIIANIEVKSPPKEHRPPDSIQLPLAPIFRASFPEGKTAKFGSTASHTTPKKGASSKMTTKAVPAVLAMLQKASQKRKLIHELDHELDHQNDVCKNVGNPKKRPRLDSSGKRLQVARRTGVPIGRKVYTDILKEGVPKMKATPKYKAKSKYVSLDVAKLSKIYVNMKYPKTFVLDLLSNDKENSPVIHSSVSIQSNTSTDSDAPTECIELHDTRRRYSDSRCSLPCL